MKQSSGELRRENANAYPRFEMHMERGNAAPSSVIASVAKQSRVFPRRDSGLLRCARNDEWKERASMLDVYPG